MDNVTLPSLAADAPFNLPHDLNDLSREAQLAINAVINEINNFKVDPSAVWSECVKWARFTCNIGDANDKTDLSGFGWLENSKIWRIGAANSMFFLSAMFSPKFTIGALPPYGSTTRFVQLRYSGDDYDFYSGSYIPIYKIPADDVEKYPSSSFGYVCVNVQTTSETSQNVICPVLKRIVGDDAYIVVQGTATHLTLKDNNWVNILPSPGCSGLMQYFTALNL